MFYRKDKEDLEETEDNEIYLLGSGFLHPVVGKEVWNLWATTSKCLKLRPEISSLRKFLLCKLEFSGKCTKLSKKKILFKNSLNTE